MDDMKIEKYSEYKESGIKWIGPIPKHWGVLKLGNLLNATSTRNQPDLPLLSITREKGVILRNLDDEEENHNFIPDDLSNYKVIRKGQFGMNKMKAWQGSYGMSDFDGIVSPAYFIFEVDKEINSEFFHAAIRSRLYVSFFGAASDGVRIGQWDLSKPRMREIPFLVPPKEEQTTIAQFLDRKATQIDKAIAQKEKLIELLKEHRQILINKAVTRGLNPNVKLKPSVVEWIGEIPEHWEVIKLKRLTTKITDGEHISPDFTVSGMPFLSAKDVREGFIEFPDNKFVSMRDGKKFRLRCNPERDDILLVSRGATIGRVSKVTTDDEFCLLGSVILMKPNSKVLPDYLLRSMENKILQDNLLNTSHFSAQQAIYLVNVSEVKIAVPSHDEQRGIVSYIRESSVKMTDAISLKEQEIEKLKEYKATLINSAVTGKIKVC